MGNRQLAWIVAIVIVLAVAAYFAFRPPGAREPGSGQPAPHAIDQSQ